MERRVIEVPVEDCTVSPLNVRRERDDVTELAASIHEKGVVEPLIARLNAGGYEVIVGSRRLQAAQMAKLKTVPVIPVEATDAEVIVISLIENVHRSPLGLAEEAEAILKFMELNPQLKTREAVAQVLGRSRSGIKTLLDAYGLMKQMQGGVHVEKSPPAKERARGQTIPAYHAQLIAQLTGRLHRKLSKEETEQVMKAIAPLDKENARHVVKEWAKTPEREIAEVIAEAVVSRVLLELPLPLAGKLSEHAKRENMAIDKFILQLLQQWSRITDKPQNGREVWP
jgi:ParB family chromosome partitioning protein